MRIIYFLAGLFCWLILNLNGVPGLSKVSEQVANLDTMSETGTKALLLHPFKPIVCIADDKETIRCSPFSCHCFLFCACPRHPKPKDMCHVHMFLLNWLVTVNPHCWFLLAKNSPLLHSCSGYSWCRTIDLKPPCNPSGNNGCDPPQTEKSCQICVLMLCRLWNYKEGTVVNTFDNHNAPDKGVSKLCLLNELDDSLLLVASSQFLFSFSTCQLAKCLHCGC